MRSPALHSLLIPGKLYWYRFGTHRHALYMDAIDYRGSVIYTPVLQPGNLVWVLVSMVYETQYLLADGKVRRELREKEAGETLELITDEMLARVVDLLPDEDVARLPALLQRLVGLEEGEIARIKKIRDL